MLRVFVYGTLLTGESNHRIAAPYVQSVQPGCIGPGQLVDVGPYPALWLTEDGVAIEGEWLEINETGLPALDELEEYYGPDHPDNDYERIHVQDLYRPELQGWVYVWKDSRGFPVIPGGSWRSYHRRRKGFSGL